MFNVEQDYYQTRQLIYFYYFINLILITLIDLTFINLNLIFLTPIKLTLILILILIILITLTLITISSTVVEICQEYFIFAQKVTLCYCFSGFDSNQLFECFMKFYCHFLLLMSHLVFDHFRLWQFFPLKLLIIIK